MRTLAPTRVRCAPYGVKRVFLDLTATCRLCADSCTFAGDDAKLDWKDALAWCHGHLAVYHPHWYRERCPHNAIHIMHVNGEQTCTGCGHRYRPSW